MLLDLSFLLAVQLPLVSGSGLATFPDAVARPRFAVADQQATALPAQPESAIVPAAFPDRIGRPGVCTAHHQAFVGPPDAAVPTPVRVTFPDRAARVPTQAPQAFALAPQPERTAPLVAVTFPDRTARSPAALAGWFALAPQPERTSPLVAVTFPDRVLRGALPVATAQAFATDTNPPAVAAPALVQVSFPDRIARPSLSASRQQAETHGSFPLPAASTPPFSSGVFPDAIARPTAGRPIAPRMLFAVLSPEGPTQIAYGVTQRGFVTVAIDAPPGQQAFATGAASGAAGTSGTTWPASAQGVVNAPPAGPAPASLGPAAKGIPE